MNYGNLLKQERIKRKMSQQELADLSGFTKRAIAYWESGKRKMTLENAEKVFEALEMRLVIERGAEHVKNRSAL